MFGTRKREVHHFDWVIADFVSQLNAKLNFRYGIHQMDIKVEGKWKPKWNDTVTLTITCRGQFQITNLLMRADGGDFVSDLFTIADQKHDVFTDNRRIVRIKKTHHSFGVPEYDFEIN